MKNLIKNLITISMLVLISTLVTNAQHQMNHSQKDTTKKMMHQMMNDSTKMHHMEMDSTKMKQMKMQHKMAKENPKEASVKKDIWNTHCPVKGGEVDPEAPTVSYKGKTIGFCCPGCESKFMENPEKYMEQFNDDGTLKK